MAPADGRGIRTRISDDPAWLPFVAGYYIDATGDAAILDEIGRFLKAPLLKPGQEDDYGLPAARRPAGPLYEHCLRGLDRVDRLGAHGLPLMGNGDWNDGMNRVGAGGKGESVWLAWFAIAVFRRFAGLAEARGDATRAGRPARDGPTRWPPPARRTPGTATGTAAPTSTTARRWARRQNNACQIDSIAAVLGGALRRGRPRACPPGDGGGRMPGWWTAQGRLIRLFTPPFDAEPMDPGYIKGYLPGIRENGGQYTHAATWVVQAFAALGRGRLASELLTLLNPIRHAEDPQGVETYRVEPYVVAGDVYSRPPHVGRGGWTWYTGSASWLYRTIVEAILGFRRHGDRLAIDPCIPPEWSGYEITYRFRSSTYRIAVENPRGLEAGRTTVWLDGQAQPEPLIPLADDGRTHQVRVEIA